MLSGGHYYNESYADLVNYAGGNSPYLSDTVGLFQETVYYSSNGSGAAKGYVYETAVAHGETAARLAVGATGGPILLSSYTYTTHTVGGQTIYPVASYTTYSNEDGTGAATTELRLHVVRQFVPDRGTNHHRAGCRHGQNGSNAAATTEQWFDDHGKLTWSMNELGRVTYYGYDSFTGRLTQTIEDIDAATVTSLGLTSPTGWTLPSSGGVNATTDYQHDALGRVTQTLGPAHMSLSLRERARVRASSARPLGLFTTMPRTRLAPPRATSW